MLLRQVPTTRFNSAGYPVRLDRSSMCEPVVTQRPAHEWLTAKVSVGDLGGEGCLLGGKEEKTLVGGGCICTMQRMGKSEIQSSGKNTYGSIDKKIWEKAVGSLTRGRIWPAPRYVLTSTCEYLREGRNVRRKERRGREMRGQNQELATAP